MMNTSLPFTVSIRLCLLFVIILSAGCGNVHETDNTTIVESTTVPDILTLEQAQQYGKAADLLLLQARQTNPPEQTRLLLRAVSDLIKANNPGKARRALNLVRADPENRNLSARIKQLASLIFMSEGNTDKALALLIPDITLPEKLQAMTYELRARAFLLSGNMLESVRERIFQENLLTGQDKINHNREQIWNTLQQLSPSVLTQLRLDPPPDILSGWMELATINKTSIHSPELFETEIAAWKKRYPGHPASFQILDKLMARYKAIKQPEKLALIIPLSGKLAKPAMAIRDGFLAAYYQNRTNRARIRIKIYDTSLPGRSIESLYRQAVRDGAEFVIGPLEKDRVASLANMADLTIPVLTLNQVENMQASIGNFFQFGLSPEDEARQVAERASLEGLIRAAIIAPNGEWGERLTRSFSKRFQELGGTVLEQARYNFNSNDLSNPILKLLNLDESKRRFYSLRNALPTEIKFEPRRRQDIDFIFMVAFPRHARLIAPQLRFHQATDIPVYTTSSAYNGTESVQKNRDMNGIVICDSAWILSPPESAGPLHRLLNKIWPQNMGRYARLYAMGIDAYHLAGQVKWLQSNPGERFDGVTGKLYINEQNQVMRNLKWGKFIRGRVTLLKDVQPQINNQQTPELIIQ
ncbi:MAG TPA: hypothetical protein ENI65_10935 [Gammaproteobacteria bacterium]|nr:hypothetical protein [Gammaproteobacteria bacterium]